MQVTFRKHGEIWQWDRNRRLICVGMDDPLAWQVHMASPHDDTDAYVLLPYRAEDGEICVDIPNVLLQKPGLVAVYAYHVATKEKHTHTCYTFSVNRREMPADYVYTETELWDWQAIEQAERQRTQAEAAREESMHLCIEAAAAATAAADLAAENAKTAAENVKDGYTPQKGVDYFTEEDKAELSEELKLTVDQSYSAESENAQSGKAVAQALSWKPLAVFTLDEAQAGVSSIMLALPTWELLKTATSMRLEAEIKAGDGTISSQIFKISVSDKNSVSYEHFFCYATAYVEAGQAAFCSAKYEFGENTYLTAGGTPRRRYMGYYTEPTVYTGPNSLGYARSFGDVIVPEWIENPSYPPYLRMELLGGGTFAAGTSLRVEVC